MPQKVNLIFQGGGVKGVAFVGALTALEKVTDIEVIGIGGVSAGAIVAALYAAGYTPDEMKAEIYRKPLSSLVRTPRTGYLGWAPRILWSNGVHTTAGLYEWLRELLERKEIHTFADLRKRADEQGRSCKILKILTANVSDQAIETISNADSGEEVASAVAKSISIPFYFRPYVDGHRVFVDGGLLSNYPLWLFQDSPLATVAFKLRSEPSRRAHSGSWVVDYVWALIGTMLNAHDKARLGAPLSVVEIPIDASFVRATDFKIEELKRDLLFANGQAAVALVDWKALPKVRPTVFSDPYAAQVLEDTASALAKHLARTTSSKPNLRSYDFYNSTYFVRTDGSAEVEDHFQIRNGGPGSISMIECGTNYSAESNTSFLDLKVSVECDEPNEAVILPTVNKSTEKRFAIALIPPVAMNESREVRLRYCLPTVTFRDLMQGKPDSVEVDVTQENGIREATLIVQLATGRLRKRTDSGTTKPITESSLPGTTGIRWSFKDIPAPKWNFEVTFQREEP